MIETVYLDCETTGLRPPPWDNLVEVCLVTETDDVLVNMLVNPGCPISAKAQAIHGITQAMVADAPAAHEVASRIVDICRGKRVVIYNAPYDCQYFPGLKAAAAEILCAMQIFAAQRGGSYVTLVKAARLAGHDWSGMTVHRAQADCLALRSVWRWLERISCKDLPAAAVPSDVIAPADTRLIRPVGRPAESGVSVNAPLSISTAQHGAPWSREESSALLRAWQDGMPVIDLARKHKRKIGAITSRLEKQGVISQKEAQRLFMQATDALTGKAYPLAEKRAENIAAGLPERHGAPWDADEIDHLRAAWALGGAVAQIAEDHQRKAGAIAQKLRALALIGEAEVKAVLFGDPWAVKKTDRASDGPEDEGAGAPAP